MAIEIVGLPIKHADFPVHYVNVCQRVSTIVNHCQPLSTIINIINHY